MELSVTFIGTGASVPSAYRGLSATLLTAGGVKALFDCGEGTQRQLMRSVGLVELGAVFITHLHADHWLGLPGMLKTFDLRGRERPLSVYGPAGLKESLSAFMSLYGRLGYSCEIYELTGNDSVDFDGFSVNSFAVQHGTTAFGYSVIEEDRPGRFDPQLATALGVSPGPDFGRLQRGETVAGVTPEQVVGDTRPGRVVVLSGDTAPCSAVLREASGADLLVHEATFLKADSARAEKTDHTTAEQAAKLAATADVKLLALTHISSRYTAKAIAAEASAEFPRVFVPRDFDSVELPLPERGQPLPRPFRR